MLVSNLHVPSLYNANQIAVYPSRSAEANSFAKLQTTGSSLALYLSRWHALLAMALIFANHRLMEPRNVGF